MKFIIYIFILLIPWLLPAQQVTVSDELQTRDDASYHILDDQRGNVLLFRDKSSKFEVVGFDEQMRKKWDKEIELDKRRPEIIDVVSVNGDFCVLYTFKQKGDIILKAHRYNPGANLVDSVTIVNLKTLFYKPYFEAIYSEDNKTVLLWSIENQNEITAIAFHLGRMRMLWERTIKTEDFVFARDFHQMLVNNDGQLFMVLKKDNRKAKQDEHYLEVFEFGKSEEDGGNMRRFDVPMQGYLTYDAYFTYDNLNHSLVAGGLYSEDNTTRADGLFYLSIPMQNTDEQVLAFHPFDKDFVNILIEKDKSKNKGLPEVTVQEIVLRQDGGIILIGELAKEFVRGGASSGYYARNGIRPIVDYYYDDIFLISMHPDGRLHWKNILHKKQYSQDDGAAFSSYFLAKTPQALRVVFNDEIKTENTVSEYVITGSGDYDRNAVMNTERKELSLRFREGLQISANTFIVPSERRHRLKLVKVSFE